MRQPAPTALDLSRAKPVELPPAPKLEELRPGLDLSQAKDVRPPAPKVTELPPRTRAGYTLARGVLWIISTFLGIVLLLLIVSEWQRASALDAFYSELRPTAANVDSTGIARFDVVAQRMQEERAEFRKFWLDMVQLILLGALLPVLTALLGYIFGTHEKESSSESE